jgi:phosphatidylserine/phosphatidylglycerophosphate/cardiolipin synthase-like enzyme
MWIRTYLRRRLSMQSVAWRTLGTDSILGYVRADLKRASRIVWVLGPWIDGFFAQILTSCLPPGAELRVVTRPPGGANSSFAEHASAARACLMERPNTILKLHANLHAKLIIIDEQIVYCGSANWYRYSLEESREIVCRGPAAQALGLLDEVQVLWDQAGNAPLLTKDTSKTKASVEGYTEEVIDPVVAAKLKEVPGSFIISRPSRRR